MSQPPPQSGPNPWYPHDPQQPLRQPPPAAGGSWQAAHDPRRPMGVDEHASVSIDSFEPPKNRAPVVIVVVVGLVLAVLVAAAYLTSRTPISPTSPTPSQQTTTGAPSQPGTAQPSGNRIPFHSELDDADGEWEIVSAKWTDRGLELEMTLEVTKGEFDYRFFCLDNATTDDYDPEPSGANSLNSGTLREGEKVKGVVVFDKPKGDTTVILADSSGRQITALIAEG